LRAVRFMGHPGLLRMTQRKSLVNQQVRREREIFGSFVTRLKVARPPLRRLAALVQSRLYTILYTIYLSLTLTYTLDDNLTQQTQFLLETRMGHLASPTRPNRNNP
jgi:hypothetical protein